MTRKLVFAKL